MFSRSKVSETAATFELVDRNTRIREQEPDRATREAHTAQQDAATLTALGKRPILKRRFGLVSITAFSSMVINTWGGVFQILGVGLLNGGPAGSFWGWLIVWAGTMAIFSCLAELASIAPTSGGQYHWVSLLAPASSHRVFSYITGWLTVLGWMSGVASSTYISGTMLQALVQFVDANYQPQLWQGVLFTYAVVIICGIVTIGFARALPAIETILLTVYALGFFAIIVPMVYLAPQKASAQTVFLYFINGGGWPLQGLSFLVGLQGWAFSALGADSTVHMSEEVHNAAATVPRSMIISLTFNFLLGTIMLLAELFCIPDPDALVSLGLQYPFTQVFLQSTGSVAGSAIMIVVIIFNQVGLNISNVAAASRMLWAFSRDGGVPGWRWISRVPPRLGLPVRAIAVVLAFTVLITLIGVGSSVAFNDVLSLTTDAFFGSYFVACALLLYRRLQGRIKQTTSIYPTQRNLGATRSASTDHSIYQKGNVPGVEGHLVCGPFFMPGWFGIGVNMFACAYMLLVLFFSFWPPATPVTPASMNYSSVMFFGTMFIGVIYFAFWGKRTYNGPAVEVVEN